MSKDELLNPLAERKFTHNSMLLDAKKEIVGIVTRYKITITGRKDPLLAKDLKAQIDFVFETLQERLREHSQVHQLPSSPLPPPPHEAIAYDISYFMSHYQAMFEELTLLQGKIKTMRKEAERSFAMARTILTPHCKLLSDHVHTCKELTEEKEKATAQLRDIERHSEDLWSRVEQVFTVIKLYRGSIQQYTAKVRLHTDPYSTAHSRYTALAPTSLSRSPGKTYLSPAITTPSVGTSSLMSFQFDAKEPELMGMQTMGAKPRWERKEYSNFRPAKAPPPISRREYSPRVAQPQGLELERELMETSYHSSAPRAPPLSRDPILVRDPLLAKESGYPDEANEAKRHLPTHESLWTRDTANKRETALTQELGRNRELGTQQEPAIMKDPRMTNIKRESALNRDMRGFRESAVRTELGSQRDLNLSEDSSRPHQGILSRELGLHSNPKLIRDTTASPQSMAKQVQEAAIARELEIAREQQERRETFAHKLTGASGHPAGLKPGAAPATMGPLRHGLQAKLKLKAEPEPEPEADGAAESEPVVERSGKFPGRRFEEDAGVPRTMRSQAEPEDIEKLRREVVGLRQANIARESFITHIRDLLRALEIEWNKSESRTHGLPSDIYQDLVAFLKVMVEVADVNVVAAERERRKVGQEVDRRKAKLLETIRIFIYSQLKLNNEAGTAAVERTHMWRRLYCIMQTLRELLTNPATVQTTGPASEELLAEDKELLHAIAERMRKTAHSGANMQDVLVSIKTVEKELADNKREYADNIKKLKEELRTHEQAAAEHQELQRRLKADITRLTTELDKYKRLSQEDKTALEQERRAHGQDVVTNLTRQIEALQEELGQLRVALTDQETNAQRLSADVEVHQQEEVKAKQDKAKLHLLLEEQKRREQKLATDMETLQQDKVRLSQLLEEQRRKERKLAADLEVQTKDAVKMKQSLEERKKKDRQVNSDIDQQREQIAALQKLLDEQKEREEDLINQLEEQKRQVANLEQLLEEHKGSADELSAQANQHQQQVALLQKALDEEKKRRQQLEKELHQQKGQAANLSRLLEEERQREHGLNAELAELKAQSEALEQSVLPFVLFLMFLIKVTLLH